MFQTFVFWLLNYLLTWFLTPNVFHSGYDFVYPKILKVIFMPITDRLQNHSDSIYGWRQNRTCAKIQDATWCVPKCVPKVSKSGNRWTYWDYAQTVADTEKSHKIDTPKVEVALFDEHIILQGSVSNFSKISKNTKQPNINFYYWYCRYFVINCIYKHQMILQQISSVTPLNTIDYLYVCVCGGGGSSSHSKVFGQVISRTILP